MRYFPQCPRLGLLPCLPVEHQPALIIRFELAMLTELGFGLDLARCAVTGSPDDLSHVSPKSGKAVSRRAAQPYLDRLLKLPSFLVEGQGGRRPSPADILSGFALTGFFLRRHILDPRGLREPPERERLIEMATRAAANAPPGESSTA